MPSDPIRDVWNRVRGLGRKVEEEKIGDFESERPGWLTRAGE